MEMSFVEIGDVGSETTSANFSRSAQGSTVMIAKTLLSWMPEKKTSDSNKLLRNLFHSSFWVTAMLHCVLGRLKAPGSWQEGWAEKRIS